MAPYVQAPQNPIPMRPAHKLHRAKAKATRSTDNSNDNDTIDPLEEAAENHTWKYMLADIDDTFRDAEAKAAVSCHPSIQCCFYQFNECVDQYSNS